VGFTAKIAKKLMFFSYKTPTKPLSGTEFALYNGGKFTGGRGCSYETMGFASGCGGAIAGVAFSGCTACTIARKARWCR
jgi:hypothetical protein